MAVEKRTPIPSRVYNAAQGGHVCGAEDVMDDVKGKTQDVVNQETDAAILAEKNRAEGVEALHQSEINALTSQSFYAVEATQADTNINSVMSRAGVVPQIDTIYRVGSWDGTQYDTTVYSEYAWNQINDETGEWKQLDVKEYGIASDSDLESQTSDNRAKVPTVGVLQDKILNSIVYDISANHLDNGNPSHYASLSAALGPDGANVPEAYRKGGMSVSYIDEDSGEYVQKRLMKATWSTTESDWQGVDSEPVVGSKNLVESDGVDYRVFNDTHTVEVTKNLVVTDQIQRIYQTKVKKEADTYYIHIISSTAIFDGDDIFIITNSLNNSLVFESVGNGWYKRTVLATYAELDSNISFGVRVNNVTTAGTIKVRLYAGKASEELENIKRLDAAEVMIAGMSTDINSVQKNIAVITPKVEYIENATVNVLIGEAFTPLTTYSEEILNKDGTLGDNASYTTIKVDISEIGINYVAISGYQAASDYCIAGFEYEDESFVAVQSSSGAANNLIIPVEGNPLYLYVTGKTSTSYPAANECVGENTFYTKEEIDTKLKVTHQTDITTDYLSLDSGYIGGCEVGKNISECFKGTTGTSSAYHYVFNVPAGARIKIETLSGGTYQFAITDSNGVIKEFTDNHVESYTFAKYEYATLLYASKTKLSKATKISYTDIAEDVATLEEEVKQLQDEQGREGYWKGKKIWWCGTSIPAGSDETIPGAGESIAGNYPTEVGNDLEAIVINKAVGGSMCRANVRTGDYDGANISNITSCLSMTKEEIENFITNYNTLKALPKNTSWPSELSASQITRLRAASFEDRLLPYLDGTYDMPDLFVIDHGHNDYKYTLSGGGSDIGLQPTVENIGNELAEDVFMTANNNAKLVSFFGSLTDIPSGRLAEFIASVNRNCYIGAVNFIVTLILKYNPHARIMFVSNYEYENGSASQYAPLITAQDSIAKSWAYPICRVYEYLGYSNHLIPGSKTWFNSTYPAQTPATTDITVYRAFLPDGVHPHSDITGNANNIYAGIISNFIRKIGC